MGKGWKIPHKVAAAQKKGKLFTKLAREISVLARLGGPDPEGNPRLKVAIQAARSASCPKGTIERAIKKGSGQVDGESVIEDLTYEGYGPHQVGVIVECQTDNRNRLVSKIRKIFQRNEGNLGASGSVIWMFDRICLVEGKKEGVQDPEEEAIEVGADDVEVGSEGLCSFYGNLEDLDSMRSQLMERGWEITMAEPSYRPKNITDLSEEQKTEVYKFLEALEDNEDSHRVYATIE